MRTPIFLSVLFFAIISFLACDNGKIHTVKFNSINPALLPYSFTIIDTHPIPGEEKPFYYGVDLNNDGVSEMIEINNTQLQDGGSAFFQINRDFRDVIVDTDFPSRIYLSGIDDIDRNGQKEIMLFECYNNQVKVYICYMQNNTITRQTFIAADKSDAVSDNELTWESGACYLGATDINNDGHNDLIFSIQTGRAYQPRGILFYDRVNEKIIKKFIGGFQAINMIHLSMNQKEKEKLIFGTTSPGNSKGKMIAGADDMHSYLLTIEPPYKGEIQKEVIGIKGTNAKPFLVDLTNDGQKEYLVTKRSFTSNNEDNYLQLRNKDTGETIKNLDKSKLFITDDIAFIDSDNDGALDIVYGWSDGQLLISKYNPVSKSLASLHRIRIPDLLFIRIIVADIIPGGDPEIICQGNHSGKNILLVFSKTLDLLAARNNSIINGEHSIFINKSGQPLLIAHDPDNYHSCMITEKTFFTYIVNNIKAHLTLLIFSIIIFTVTLSLLLINAKRVKVTLLNTAVDSHQFPAFITTQTGKIIKTNKHILTLASLDDPSMANDLYDILSKTQWNSVKEWINRTIHSSHACESKKFIINENNTSKTMLVNIHPIQFPRKNERLYLVTIQDITKMLNTEATFRWADFIQELTHSIKTPVNTLMLRLQEIDDESHKTNPDASFILNSCQISIDQIKKLETLNSALLKLVPTLEQNRSMIDINRLIKNWLQKEKTRKPRLQEIILKCDSELPLLYVDKEQLQITLENIIFNSLDATTEKQKISVRTHLIRISNHASGETNDYIEIIIADTGRGVPENMLHRVFDPMFTKFKPGGTGLGLTICKKIIAEHDGEITLRSKKDEGTTVTIRLPVVPTGQVRTED